jgi:nucleoside-diphosphate-sugar epimerase
MRRVLVTGASGFVGRCALAPLLRQGYEVHAIGRRAQSGSGLQWHRGDLLDPADVDRLLGRLRPSHLLHLAWYAEPGAFWSSVENFRWVAATQNLLESFHRAGGLRAVAAGSCAEYDASSGECDENLTPIRPATIYGKCKSAARLQFEAYCEYSGISGAWGRIFHLYGPGEDRQRLVAALCTGFIDNRPVPCSHGRQVRDFLHVQDAADALVGLLSSDIGGSVNLGSGKPVTVAQMARTLADMAGRPDLLLLGAREAPEGEPERLVPAVRRLVEELGWRPVYDLESGLRHTLDWWKAARQSNTEVGHSEN